MITIDFMMGLLETPKRYEFIQIIVDRLTKFAHFLHVNMTYGFAKCVIFYIDEIVHLHGL